MRIIIEKKNIGSYLVLYELVLFNLHLLEFADEEASVHPYIPLLFHLPSPHRLPENINLPDKKNMIFFLFLCWIP